MITTTKNKTTKPQRTLQFIQTGLVNLLWINQGAKTDGYTVEDRSGYHNGDGAVYELTKTDGTVYNVHLDGPASQCDCTGFEYRGMATRDGKGCKHIAALTRLTQLGKL